MVFPEEMQEKIADVARWMDAVMAPLGTEAGHARSAVRAIFGLARLTGGDMARVEEIIAEHIDQAWRATGRGRAEEFGMVPIFTEAEVACSTARVA
jgi:hypothetical protein